MKTLYHGSNTEIDFIDLSKARKFKDFGRGFYLTELRDQAESWASAVSKIRGGTKTITVFEVDESKMANVNKLEFEIADKNWAHFILSNRDRNFGNLSDSLSNQDNKYDVVEGPVGNDDIATLLSQFVMGIIDDDYLVKKLKYKKLNHQMSFHTKEGIALLSKTGVLD